MTWGTGTLGQPGQVPITALNDGSCGENATGRQVGEAWPPDFRGRLQGIGFSEATGKRLRGSARYVIRSDDVGVQRYDLMSYCASGSPLEDLHDPAARGAQSAGVGDGRLRRLLL